MRLARRLPKPAEEFEQAMQLAEQRCALCAAVLCSALCVGSGQRAVGPPTQ